MSITSVTKKEEQQSCKRCNDNFANQKIRSDHVCRKCFSTYVMTKAIKRMEKYRLRGSTFHPKKLLLPLSFGPCSSSLLYILDNHLQGQYDRMKRAAYELVVVHIDLYLAAIDREFSTKRLEQFKSRFHRHLFISHGLEESLNLKEIDWTILGRPQPSETSNLNEQLQQFLGSMSSPTARADIIDILLNRLLVHIAKNNGCESILFGDSTTKLAEKTLSEISKGRGISLPWQICDVTSYGLGIHYPLKDILKNELVSFSMITPPLHHLITYEQVTHISVNSKSATINDLMVQYFESAEADYPSIVANVVRTISKLGMGASTDNFFCGICGCPCSTCGVSDSETPSDTLKSDKPTYKATVCFGCSKLVSGKNLTISSLVD